MVDDLVKRLNELSTPERRKHGSLPDIAMKEAADRLDQVKELEAEVARLKENCYEQYKRINKLEAALREILSCWTYWQCRVLAKAALPHPLEGLREKKDDHI